MNTRKDPLRKEEFMVIYRDRNAKKCMPIPRISHCKPS